MKPLECRNILQMRKEKKTDKKTRRFEYISWISFQIWPQSTSGDICNFKTNVSKMSYKSKFAVLIYKQCTNQQKFLNLHQSKLQKTEWKSILTTGPKNMGYKLPKLQIKGCLQTSTKNLFDLVQHGPYQHCELSWCVCWGCSCA